MVIIYPLGIPALYAWLLWSKRHKLCSDNESSARVVNRHDENELRPTRFLWKSYTPNMYYWEVIECMRRLLLTGAIVFIAPGTVAQAAVACVLAVVSAIIAVYCQPHVDARDGQIYTGGAMIIFLSMFLSLLMKTDVRTGTSSSQAAFALVLVVLNIAMVIAAVVQVALVGHRAYTDSRQNSVLGLRKVVRGHSATMRRSTVPKSAGVAPKTSVIELRSESDSGDNNDSVEHDDSGADDTRKQQQTSSHQAAQQC
jgi:ABC-type multidrug transport system fused ATPase/permease subunit